jgi:hypothetical protein
MNEANYTYSVAVQEVRVTSVNVGGFHGYQIFHKLVRRIHDLLEE